VTAAEQVPAVEVVPPAVETDLDDIAGELVERRVQLVELAGVRDATAVGLLQRVAVHVGDVAHALGPADRAVVRCGLAHVAGGAEQLRMGVAHVESRDRAAPDVAQDRSAGECVVNV
jgi:hypothetical protein